jgi:hypothetical protein
MLVSCLHHHPFGFFSFFGLVWLLLIGFVLFLCLENFCVGAPGGGGEGKQKIVDKERVE